MGSSDDIRFTCPICGADIYVSSNSGPCDLEVFDRLAVPNEIAREIDGENARCPDCEREWTVTVIGSVPSTIPMTLL